MSSTQPPRTPQQAKAWLRAQGQSARDFARAHGFDEQTVYELLNGRQSGHRGKAHRVAVALGLKPAESEPAAAPIDGEDTDRMIAMALAAIRRLRREGVQVIGVQWLDQVPVIGIHSDPPADVSGRWVSSFLSPLGDMDIFMAPYHGVLLRWIRPAPIQIPQILIEETEA